MTRRKSTLRTRSVIGSVAAVLLLSAGLTGIVAAPASAAITEVNDNSASVVYSAGWTASTGNAGYLNSDAHYSGTTGATATYTFTGTTVTWIGGQNSDHGKADVALCNATGGACGAATTVDTYAPASTPQESLFAAAGLTNATHTLKITVRSDTSHTGHYTDVDAFLSGVEATPLTGTYYVDNAVGSNCSDAGAGTVTTAPWCDFANLNGKTFGSGAHILLKRGDSFSGELGKLYGSGTIASPIVLGAYGAGARPHISGASQASNRGIWIQDASNWTVQDLEISNVGAGLVFWYTTNGHTGLIVNDVYTHNVQGVFAGSPAQSDLPGMYHSAGILITGNVPVTASATAVNDDVDISGFDSNSGGQQGFLSTSLGNHSVSNVRLTTSYFHSSQSGENFDNLQNMTITGMRLDGTGTGANHGSGTTALFFWSSSTVTVSNSILNGEADTGSPDQTETDLEAFDDHIRFLGDLFSNSAGTPIEILEINGYTNNYQSNQEVGDNLFYGFGSGTALRSVTPTPPLSFSGTAHDNIYAASGSTFTSGVPGWTLTNNNAVPTTGTYNAGFNFSSTQGTSQWRYQYFTTGGGWLDINTFDSANQRWGTNGYVSRFDLTPDTCGTCAIARDWVAPSAGTIAIRSRVLKDALGGDGVTARITKNGAQIWPTSGGAQAISASDINGFDANLTVTVAAGDSIRFEVTDGGGGNADSDATAWAPSIAYQ
jgi:hypothetical protein